ncbi:MAG: SpoIID/LytB domain-containing protein [Parachlamydiaceae bacterium]
MVIRILFLLLALVPMSVPAHAGWFDDVLSFFGKNYSAPPKIRVLVVHDQEGVVLEVKGKYKIHDPHTGDHMATRFVGKRKFIQAVRDGLKWGEEFPGVFQLVIIPDEKATTTIVDGIEYRGPIYVYDVGGKISIVNEIGIEDFLSSTLAQRYKGESQPEFLASVVIAARTAAYYTVEHPRSPFWSVDGRMSGYQGYAVIDEETSVEHAIHDTRYMVMSSVNPGENKINTFPAQWSNEPVTNQGQQVVSRITLAEAAAMAKKGDHAAKILAKAFPGTKIELINYSK